MKIDWNYKDVSIHKVENGFLLGKRGRGYCDTSQDEAFFATAADLVLAILKIEDEKTEDLICTTKDVTDLMIGLGSVQAEILRCSEEKKNKEREPAL
jgi:hypothetical protein